MSNTWVDSFFYVSSGSLFDIWIYSLLDSEVDILIEDKLEGISDNTVLNIVR